MNILSTQIFDKLHILSLRPMTQPAIFYIAHVVFFGPVVIFLVLLWKDIVAAAREIDPIFLKEHEVSCADGKIEKMQLSIKSETIAIPFYSDLEIACGNFRDGYSEYTSETIDVENLQGNLDPKKHFIVCAVGDSMNGGRSPIYNGDYLLFEIDREYGTYTSSSLRQLFRIRRQPAGSP